MYGNAVIIVVLSACLLCSCRSQYQQQSAKVELPAGFPSLPLPESTDQAKTIVEQFLRQHGLSYRVSVTHFSSSADGLGYESPSIFFTFVQPPARHKGQVYAIRRDRNKQWMLMPGDRPLHNQLVLELIPKLKEPLR